MREFTVLPRHIHLIGICGTAMASLAGMLQQQGHRVTGSDAAAYPPMSHLLASLAIPVFEPYSAANLDPAPDLVVVGNAISRGNVELEHVLDTRIPFCSMAALLHEEFLAGRESLVVAGTHGKTTTPTPPRGGARNRPPPPPPRQPLRPVVFDRRRSRELRHQLHGAQARRER